MTDINIKYARAFQTIEDVANKRIREQKYTALGHTSNLDLICDFNIEHLNKLLETNFINAKIKDMKLVPKIYSMEELLSNIVYFSSRGIGGEVDIENINVLIDNFSLIKGMGGTGAQAAMALSKVGYPTLLHLTDDSKEVCEILESPYIFIVDEGNNLIHTGEKKSINEQEIHAIIQFKKGDILSLNGEKIEIPCSNRLIVTKTTVNEILPLSEPYFKWIEEHAENVPSNVLSSFNVILDKKILRDRIRYIKEHVKKYKSNNPDGIVFFEDAHYHDISIKKICLDQLYPIVDIVSLNEEELEYTLKLYNFEIDIKQIDKCIDGVKFIREIFKIQKGVIVHTKDYSLYVGNELSADIEQGLMYGNMLATAKAAYGSYGSFENIKSVLEYELSPVGKEYCKEVREKHYGDTMVLVPSKYMDKPKYTIGLGDSFIGGVQMCF